jgi:hypothetical protein
MGRKYIDVAKENEQELSKMEAIEYLVKNAVRNSEWEEAGMFHAVMNVVNSKSQTFTIGTLKELIVAAENN